MASELGKGLQVDEGWASHGNSAGLETKLTERLASFFNCFANQVDVFDICDENGPVSQHGTSESAHIYCHEGVRVARTV